MTDRKKPGLAFWATVVVVIAAYLLSWGPAMWLFTFGRLPESAQFAIYYAYAPIGWLAGLTPATERLLTWYGNCWVPP